MARERTNTGVLGSLQRLLLALTANSTELSHLEGGRTKLDKMLARVHEISMQQAALTASKQEATRELQQLLGEGQRLATVLRVSVKEHYGIRSEKLAEFGLQPFRGRTVKPAPETPQTPEPEAPKPAGPATPTKPDL